MTTYDVLDGPGREQPRRAPRLLLVGIVVLAALAWGADRWAQSRELDRLVAAVSATEGVVDASAESLRSLEQYQGTGENGSAALRASLLGNLGRDAGRWTGQLDEQHRAVSSVHVLPWHSGLRRARATYLTRVGSWSRFLAQIHANPEQLLGERPELRTTRDAAATALDAVAGGRRDVAHLTAGLRGEG